MNSIKDYSEIIIIKTGQFETFVSDNGDSFSLGDVLRTTSLLHVLGTTKPIQWLTQKKALVLLPKHENFKGLEFDLDYLNSAAASPGVLIINLERDPSLAPVFKNRKDTVGFIFENSAWKIKDIFGNLFTLEAWNRHCQEGVSLTWGGMLQKLVGSGAYLSHPIYQKPEIKVVTDIGLNWHVGNKWPSKKIADQVWKKIESDLGFKYKLSWQTGLDSIPRYADWLASNRLIISVDSLGLHLASAMDIPVIALFGSTDYRLHDAASRSRFIAFDAPKAEYSCMPCWKNECFQKIHCSEHLDFNKIYDVVDNFLN